VWIGGGPSKAPVATRPHSTPPHPVGSAFINKLRDPITLHRNARGGEDTNPPAVFFWYDHVPRRRHGDAETSRRGDPRVGPDEISVVANTGDDIELGGHLVCPDVDTVLCRGWRRPRPRDVVGIADDTTTTHEELRAARGGCRTRNSPRYLDDDAQIAGREIGRWRRFSGVGEFMEIGDRDRAVHLTRTGLLDEGHTLTEAIRTLADAFDLDVDLLPMSDDPVATLIHTEAGETIHFQEYWVARRGPRRRRRGVPGRRTRSRPPLSRKRLTTPS